MLSKKQITLLFFVVLTFAMAAPSVAWAGNSPLNDSQEPGSVLVFPLFEKGTVPCPPDLPYGCAPGSTLPKTSFEISVVCPEGINACADDDVDIHVEWVCPGFGALSTCVQRDFFVNTTVGGTVRFEPVTELCRPTAPFDADERLHACGNVIAPQCNEGYAIAWVVDEFNRPIKFDGLLGDAVLRESSTAVTAYNAIPIQAAPSIKSRALIPLGPGGALKFDGTGYQEVTGAITGSVQLDFVNTTGVDQDQTSLVLLTLDVNTNHINNATDVDLNFYNESEVPTSHHFTFTCFAETGALFMGDFGVPFNTGGFGQETSISPETLKALVQSGPATQTNILTGVTVPATLLGLILTRECPTTGCNAAAGVPPLRDFAYPLLNDSVPVATNFVP